MIPKVSICIPTYRQTDYLKKTLESIQSQEYKDYEIVITDDSPDDSVKDLANTFDFSKNLKYFKNPERLGSPKNWNESIKKATGEYIKILHHDDWFSSPNSLNEFVKMLDQNPRADFAFCSTNIMGISKNRLATHEICQKHLDLLRDPKNLFLGNFIGAPSTTIYRKKANIQYDNKLKWLVDIDFYIRMLNQNKNFACTNEPLINVTADGDHQVTKEIINNRSIDFNEHIYLYKKIKNTLNILSLNIFLIKILKSNVFDYDSNEMIHHNINRIPIEIFLIIKIKNLKKKISFFMIKFIKNNFLYKHLKKSCLYIGFIVSYIRFNNLSSEKRFINSWRNRLPCLDDKTSSTPIDRHYVYHTAWAARKLKEISPIEHIDISSYIYFSTIASAFIPVKFYDYRPAPIKLSNFSSEQVDLTNLHFPDNSIESLSCLHTIEHIGLGRYGDMIDPEGDKKAIHELKRVIKPKGNFLLVVPIGKPKIMFNAHRIYAYRQILEILNGFELKEFSLVPDDKMTPLIIDASEQQADQQNYGCGCFWFIKK